MFKFSKFDWFEKYVTSISNDFVDKMHCLFTTSVLFIFATIIGTKQILGTPMQCIISPSFSGFLINFYFIFKKNYKNKKNNKITKF